MGQTDSNVLIPLHCRSQEVKGFRCLQAKYYWCYTGIYVSKAVVQNPECSIVLKIKVAVQEVGNLFSGVEHSLNPMVFSNPHRYTCRYASCTVVYTQTHTYMSKASGHPHETTQHTETKVVWLEEGESFKSRTVMKQATEFTKHRMPHTIKIS